jgi:hypothetical protein
MGPRLVAGALNVSGPLGLPCRVVIDSEDAASEGRPSDFRSLLVMGKTKVCLESQRVSILRSESQRIRAKEVFTSFILDSRTRWQFRVSSHVKSLTPSQIIR